MPQADPKPPARIVDRDAMRRARLLWDVCGACGRPAGSVHHVIPRGERGDDVLENLITLCGNGTTGCHGAEHGNAYVVKIPNGLPNPLVERRDADWVNERIGRYLADRRPDVIVYVLGKLGDEAGRAYLERRYRLRLGSAA